MESKWTEDFKEQCELIKGVLPEDVDLYHIGSTSLPTVVGKGIVDILMVVEDIQRVEDWENKLGIIGYEQMGDEVIRERRFFIKGGSDRSHHLHVFQKGNKEIERHLSFREYMIANVDEALFYAKAKRNLAKKYPTTSEDYTRKKKEFIKSMDKKVEEWFKTE